MNNVERIVYGLTKDYYVVGYWLLKDDDVRISHLRWAADKLCAACPGTEVVYVVDNSPTIRHGYFGAKKGGWKTGFFSKSSSKRRVFGSSDRDPGRGLQSLFPFIFA